MQKRNIKLLVFNNVPKNNTGKRLSHWEIRQLPRNFNSWLRTGITGTQFAFKLGIEITMTQYRKQELL